MKLNFVGIRSECPQNVGTSWGLQIEVQGQAGEGIDRSWRILNARFVVDEYSCWRFALGSSINNVTVLGDGDQRFCDDGTKAFLIKAWRWGRGVKNVQNSVTSFMDDPSSLTTSYIGFSMYDLHSKVIVVLRITFFAEWRIKALFSFMSHSDLHLCFVI